MKYLRPLLILVTLVPLFASPARSQDTLPAYPLVLVETSAGNFTLQLDVRKAPITVENFLTYVDDGFYTGTIFHRIVGGFVARLQEEFFR